MRWPAGMRQPLPTADDASAGNRLKPRLGRPLLLALGLGGALPSTILWNISGGAEKIGPAVIVATAIAGIVCVAIALAYAELATRIPDAGGAYSYSYHILGELLAWLVGWSLILFYLPLTARVAVGSTALLVQLLGEAGLSWQSMTPDFETTGSRIVRAFLPVVTVAVVGGMLAARPRLLVGANAALILAKVVALLLVAAVLVPHVTPANADPFMPFAFDGSLSWDGTDRSVIAVAVSLLILLLGVDAVATAAEEARRPQLDLPIGIVGSALLAVLLYLLLATVAVGAIPQAAFKPDENPILAAIGALEAEWPAQLLHLALAIGSLTLLVTLFYGQSRIFFAMARDGLLPPWIARISDRGTPARATIFTLLLVGAMAALCPWQVLDDLAVAGLIGLFSVAIIVLACMLVMRKRTVDEERRFGMAGAWPIGLIAITGCLYMWFAISPDPMAVSEGESAWKHQLHFLGWMGAGVVGYFFYGRKRSILTPVEEMGTDAAEDLLDSL